MFAQLTRAAATVLTGTGALISFHSAPPAATARPSVPFAIGEELVYHATFGHVPAGTARMRVEGIDTVRGRAAYHVSFAIDGGVPLFRVHDRYDSWMDVQTLASLRHTQQISEGRYTRNTTYEIFPDKKLYQKNSEAPQPSVANPLDDGSFIYAARIADIAPGQTVTDDRYFRPDRNPVVLTGLERDTVTVGAGRFPAVEVRPTIHANGIFSDGGDARIWFSDDAHRYPVQVRTKFAHFTLNLDLTSVKSGR